MLVFEQALGLDDDEFSSQVAILLREEDSLIFGALGIRALVLRLPVVDALREGGREGRREGGMDGDRKGYPDP